MARRTATNTSEVPPSVRLDQWLPDSPFRDTIVVSSTAPPGRLLQALEEVTSRDMPLATRVGKIRYLPSLLGSKEARQRARLELDRPFLSGVSSAKGSLMLERSADEIVLGTVGKLHQFRDQEPADVRTAEQFRAFAEPNHEKLAMSVRVIPDASRTWLALEHRTVPTDDTAERRFRRYWRVIRPGGAFVTRQLLRAAVQRAERGLTQRAGPAAVS